MHTFNGKKTRIHYNSDMSGDCIIFNKETEQDIEVPCEDILNFVAEYRRIQKISVLDQMATYAAIRKGSSELRSNNLKAIGQKVFGDEKLDYSDDGNEIMNLFRNGEGK